LLGNFGNQILPFFAWRWVFGGRSARSIELEDQERQPEGWCCGHQQHWNRKTGTET
jgi:hypothetical protein